MSSLNILTLITVQITSTNYLLKKRVLHEFPQRGAKKRHVTACLLFQH